MWAFLMKHRYGRNKLICGLNVWFSRELPLTMYKTQGSIHNSFCSILNMIACPFPSEEGRLKGRLPCFFLLN